MTTNQALLAVTLGGFALLAFSGGGTKRSRLVYPDPTVPFSPDEHIPHGVFLWDLMTEMGLTTKARYDERRADQAVMNADTELVREELKRRGIQVTQEAAFAIGYLLAEPPDPKDIEAMRKQIATRNAAAR